MWVLTFPKTIPASGVQDLSLETLAKERIVLAHWVFCRPLMGKDLASAFRVPLLFSIVMDWEEAVGSFAYIRQKQYMVEGLLGRSWETRS